MNSNKKVVLITGGITGIGAEIAITLSKNNYKVVKFEDSNDDWDQLIKSSDDSSIFFESKFLSANNCCKRV